MLTTSNDSNSVKADRSLKGLLMDKGVGSCESKLRNVANKMSSVQAAMVELVAMQKESRVLNQVECMDLYLATNLKPEHAKRSRMINVVTLTTEQTKAAPLVEWRTRTEFAKAYSYSLSARLFPFKTDHVHYKQVREFVDARNPKYYKVLCAYETARLSLNCALKSLRKIALDIQTVSEESEGICESVFTNDTVKLSQRIMQQVDSSAAIPNILSGLYAP